MAYNQPSSGSFKMMGSSPAKQTKFPNSPKTKKVRKARLESKQSRAYKNVLEEIKKYKGTGKGPSEKYRKQVKKYNDAKKKLKTFETPD